MNSPGTAENSVNLVMPFGETRRYKYHLRMEPGEADVMAGHGTSEGTVMRWLREGGIGWSTIVCLTMANVTGSVLLWVALH